MGQDLDCSGCQAIMFKAMLEPIGINHCVVLNPTCEDTMVHEQKKSGFKWTEVCWVVNSTSH